MINLSNAHHNNTGGSWSIRTSLVTLVLMAVLPALGIIVFAGFQVRKEDVKEAKTNILRTVENLGYFQESVTAGSRQMLMTLAQLPEVQNYDIPACNHLFNDILRRSPFQNTIVAALPDGRAFAAGTAALMPFSVADRKYFQKTLERREFTAGEYVVAKSTAVPVFTFAYPVSGPDGQLRGVVITGCNLDIYERFLQESHLPEGSVVGIEDRNGIRLCRFPQLTGVNTEAVGKPLDTKVWGHVSGAPRRGTYVETGVDGIRRIYGFIQLRLEQSDPPYLYIRVGVPEKSAFFRARQHLHLSLFLLGIATVLAMAAAWFVGNLTITNRIRHLVDFSRQVGAGNFEVRSGLSPMKGGEIGMLAEAVDDMAANLQNREMERQRAEEAIRQLDHKNRMILETSQEGIIGLDIQGNVVFINPSAAVMTGFDPVDIIGQGLHQKIHHSRSDGAAYSHDVCPIHETLTRGVTSRIRDEVFWRKDGAHFPAVYSCAPIIENGVISGAVITFRDITERRQIEAAKARFEHQLYQSQKMESIGTLAGGIVHDFNNILTAILGYTQLAALDVNNVRIIEKSLHQIQGAGQRARELVQQILAFSRQAEQKRCPVQVMLIVKDALNLVKVAIPSTVEIKTNIQSDSVVKADPTQIHQVIMNLFTNAVHVMREKGGILEVGIYDVHFQTSLPHPDLSPGHYVKISVSDTGCGIAPENLQRIFDPFFTTKAPGEGTGLGLSVAHGIVKKHQGAITVYSELGKGSAFHIYLPCINEKAVIASESDTDAVKGNETILLVDDETIVIELVQEFLKNLGYQVLARNSSVEALKDFESHPDKFDLVITDKTMPHLTGLELSRQLMGIRPDIPIILCTGFSDAAVVQAAQDIGIREIFMKPLIIRDLSLTIRKMLDERPQT